MILVFVALLMVLHRVLLFRVARWVVLPVAMLSAWWA